MAALLRIEAPPKGKNQGFVAGIIPGDTAAPILRWMLREGLSEDEIRKYCAKKGWTVTTVH